MVLVVTFSMDIDLIKRRRGVDFALIMGVLMIFSAIISHWAFNPLRRATVAMGEISNGNLEHRVEDNIGPAKDAFNHMADRVEQMLDGQRMLLAGISHELRTPLARMKIQTALLDEKMETTHFHEDIEIVTFIIRGALKHQDSLGNESVIREGEVQRMTAGSGIQHSEYNASSTDSAHLLQIWIILDLKGCPPRP